jgi:V/A-type H+-transporting ATPase subunit E
LSNLDNLISKIIKDAEGEAQRILAEAKEKAARIAAESTAAAEKEKADIIANAEKEALKEAEQIETGKKLEIRDLKLNAKQAVINKVFALALKKLNGMSKENYWKFLTTTLAGMALSDEELILPEKYEVKDIAELNAFLKENGKTGALKLYTGGRKIEGGFIILKNGIENNNTFETLLQYYRYDLEGDVIKNLF